MAAVGGDSGSLEVVSNPPPHPVHQTLLTLNGIHIPENLATERLAGRGWDTFLLVTAPLPIVGSSSSRANPLAIRRTRWRGARGPAAGRRPRVGGWSLERTGPAACGSAPRRTAYPRPTNPHRRPSRSVVGGQNGRMSERTIFITGANSGFGLAVAREALRWGFRVAATARRVESLGPLVDAGGDRVLAAELDVTDPASVRSAVEAALGRFGRIDVLHNNAGYGLMGGVEELPEAQVRAQFDTNFFGALAVLKRVLPGMRERRCGHVLNMSSIGGLVGGAGYGAYAASKFALEGLSEALAAELGGLGVRVTLVEPSGFRTDFHGRSLQTGGEPIADYADTAGVATRGQRELDGQQAGDPGRAARAMLDVTELDDPPLRLLLGNDAVDRAAQKLQRVREDLQRMERVSRAADSG